MTALVVVLGAALVVLLLAGLAFLLVIVRRLSQEAAVVRAELEAREIIESVTEQAPAMPGRPRLRIVQGGLLAAAALVWRRSREHPIIAVSSVVTAVVAAIALLPSEGDVPRAVSPGSPSAAAPLVEASSYPAAEAVIQEAEPGEESSPFAPSGSDEPVAPSTPQGQPASAPIAEPSAPPELSGAPPEPPPEPPETPVEQPPTEPPEDPIDPPEEHEPPHKEPPPKDLCLELDLRPIIELGVCVRSLLGLL